MSIKRATICLLRNDLRFFDNQVLHWAHHHSDTVLPLYCFDPRHYGTTYHFGFPKTGYHQLRYLLETLKDLKSVLQSRGSDLLIQHGKPEEIIPQIIEKLGQSNVQAVVFHQEVTQEETDVEKNIKASCSVHVNSFWGSTLHHKDDLPFPCHQLPDVFTQFRQKVESRCEVRPLINMPDKLKPFPGGFEANEIPSVESFSMEECAVDSRSAFPFQGGESAALARLNSYLWQTNHVASYKRTRNGLIGAEYSTKFSPWLAHGCISPRQIYWETKRYEREVAANDSTYWVIFELLWRDYFKFVGMKFGNRLFYPNGLRDNKPNWKNSPQLFAAWKDGNTGIPFVDANMRELKCTGFMSNRGRQNVASFLTKDLQLDWRLGAEWFESQLVDHDVCSNYGNWLYSAGIGNDPRENRKFNMIKQAMDYDPQGEYVKLWIPEISQIDGGNVHTPWTLGGAELSRADVKLGETYPKPVLLAPEWSKHSANKRGASGKSKGQRRGIDFYFKKGGN